MTYSLLIPDCMGVEICWRPHSLSYAGAPTFFHMFAPLFSFTCWQSLLPLCMEQYITGHRGAGILPLLIPSRINHSSIAGRSHHTTTLSARARRFPQYLSCLSFNSRERKTDDWLKDNQKRTESSLAAHNRGVYRGRDLKGWEFPWGYFSTARSNNQESLDPMHFDKLGHFSALTPFPPYVALLLRSLRPSPLFGLVTRVGR